MLKQLEEKLSYDGFFTSVLGTKSEGTKQQYQAALTDFEKWSIKTEGKNLDEIIPIETTALLLAGSQSFSWMIPVVLSVLRIGLFVVSRKSE